MGRGGRRGGQYHKPATQNRSGEGKRENSEHNQSAAAPVDPAKMQTQGEPSEPKRKAIAEDSGENVSNALIAKYTQSLANWTKALVGVGIVTAGILIVHARIFVQTDQTARRSQRAFVAVRQILVEPLTSLDQGPIYKFSFGWENSGSTETVDLERAALL
jgi:hypothetical protein